MDYKDFWPNSLFTLQTENNKGDVIKHKKVKIMPEENNIQQKSKKNFLNFIIPAIILILLLVIAFILLSRNNAKTTPVNAQNNDLYDDHGCYTTGGYAWCAPKDKCIPTSIENCTKNDVTSQLCAQGIASNTTMKYTYNSSIHTCIITGPSNTTTIWDINCESTTAKASIEIRNTTVNNTQLEQAFPGCTITKK
jgi:hypothetical protein